MVYLLAKEFRRLYGVILSECTWILMQHQLTVKDAAYGFAEPVFSLSFR